MDGVGLFVRGRQRARWIGDVLIGDVGGSVDADGVVALGNEEEMEFAVRAFDFGAFYFALVVGVEQLHVSLI